MSTEGTQHQEKDATVVDMLAGLMQGRFIDEATQKFRVLVKEMTRTAEVTGGKPKGKFVITVNMTLDRDNFMLEPLATAVPPKQASALTIMYATPDGRLTKTPQPSAQHALPLSTEPREVKDVSTRTDVRDVRDIRERAANADR